MGLFQIPHIVDVLIENRCQSVSLVGVVVEGVVGGGVGGERGGGGVAVGLGVGRHDRHQDGHRQEGLGKKEEGEGGG